MKVRIKISKEINEELLEIMPEFGYSIRLKCKVKFMAKDGWSKSMDGILDTGAYISVLPTDLWNKLDFKVLATGYSMRGVVPKEECKLPVDVGEVNCILLDEEMNMTKDNKIYAFLAYSDDVPIIIGFKHLLEGFRVCFDCKTNHAFIEEK